MSDWQFNLLQRAVVCYTLEFTSVLQLMISTGEMIIILRRLSKQNFYGLLGITYQLLHTCNPLFCKNDWLRMQCIIPEVMLKSSQELENVIYLSSRISHKLVSYFHQEGERVIGFKCQDVPSVGWSHTSIFSATAFACDYENCTHLSLKMTVKNSLGVS